MAGRRSTAPSWEALTSFNGTATTRCWRGPSNSNRSQRSCAGSMAPAAADWRRDHRLWVELFVLFNFAGLTVDIFLAHSENQFRRSTEYVPLVFSAAAAITLLLLLLAHRRWPTVWRDVGHLVGWMAIVVGCGGVLLHLDSRFFY